jgi:hypothetical protein
MPHKRIECPDCLTVNIFVLKMFGWLDGALCINEVDDFKCKYCKVDLAPFIFED